MKMNNKKTAIATFSAQTLHFVVATILGCSAFMSAQSVYADNENVKRENKSTILDNTLINERLLPLLTKKIEAAVLSESEAQGARFYIKKKKLLRLTYDKVIKRASEHNLSIQTTENNWKISNLRILQREAAFDSILVGSLSFSWSRTFERKNFILRNREREPDFDTLEDNFNSLQDEFTRAENDAATTNEFNPNISSTSIGCVTVNGEPLTEVCNDQNVEFSAQNEFASFNGTPNRQTVGSINWFRPFGWGSVANIGLQSQQRYTTFHLLKNGDRIISVEDPFEVGSAFRWSSSIVAGFQTPLPFTKGFGEYGDSDNVALILARKSYEQSRLSKAQVTNTIMGQVSNAYLELVRSLYLLHVTIQHHNNMKKIRDRTQRRYDLRIATGYEKSQVEARYESVKNIEEIAWNNYLSNSNLLAELLHFEDEIIVPIEFSSFLNQQYDINLAKAISETMSVNPEILVKQYNNEINKIQIRNRKNLLRPDLTMSISATVGQSDITFGYDNLGSSLDNLFPGDNQDISISLSYKIPWGNAAAKSSLSRARINLQQSQDDLILKKNELIQTLNQVASSSLSQLTQIKLSKSNVKLAQLAYNSTRSKQNKLLVSEFEALQKLDDLLDARKSYIDAVINYKKVHVNYLTSKGHWAKVN